MPAIVLVSVWLACQLWLACQTARAEGPSQSQTCICPQGRAAVGAGNAPGPIDINRANAEQLMQLPGIGPRRAAALLQLREKRGRIRRLGVLLRVRGIGRKTLRRLRPMLRFGPGPTVNQPTSKR